MKVPLLDLTPQMNSLREEIEGAIHDVLQTNAFILGPKVRELEQAIAEYSGVRHAFGVSSGTDALLLALMALNVGWGDWVVTTPFSFFATAGVIARLGAKPVFVDITPDSFNMDSVKLGELLDGLDTLDVRKVKAILPVHLYGQCADMDAIAQTAQGYGIPIVEDAAQAIGAQYPSAGGVMRAGAMGAVGCFSFYPSKNLGAVGDAGMVVTNDDKLAEEIRIRRVHGEREKYHHAVVGGNFRMDGLQGAVLLVKLSHLESWHKSRRQNAERYERLFAARHLDAVRLPAALYRDSEAGDYHIYNQFVIRVSERDDLKSYLEEQGVGTDIYYPVPFHEQECFAYLKYRQGEFPEAERASREVLALPIYPELTEEMQTYVVDAIGQYYGR